MKALARWTLVAVLVGHGAIHLLGAAAGLGWAEVPRLGQVGVAGGLLWLLAATLLLSCAALVAARRRAWWWVAALGVAASQVAVLTAWSDARAGTLVDVVLACAAAYGFASVGPTSDRARWQDGAAAAVAAVAPSPGLLTEADLRHLPAPLAAYVRRSGAVGRPRVTSLRAELHGRIRSGPDAAWMPFAATQVNTFGAHPRRLFLMEATRSGVPVSVLHSYAGASATMRGKVLSSVTVVDAAGPEMDRSETVTILDDLVVLAPGAVADAPVRWSAVDDRHVRGVLTVGDQVVSAELSFDADHDLVDVTSADRSRASMDGATFTDQRWSTPLAGHRVVHGRRVLTSGSARWLDPAAGGWFTYVELEVDDVAHPATTGAWGPR
ncbi:hypothetical protein ASG49_04775 [Marmoricola sp. Leaf446]|uniref:DUF6544 family protein n=1 Tax=Marmoricola sp. Leaf446 TaxID=1736379 RepID=UPI0006F21217|nr:DUF6544 family protein [Marmoricola sp. Leaf446]KQT94218.1 hypothetical protein ASG49_04775 [Marmoricola sp. Leaf446]